MTLEERLTKEIEKKGWIQQEAAERIGVHRVHLNMILNQHRRVTTAIALKLEKTFGVAAEEWLRLQATRDLEPLRRGYRLKKVRA